jgi:hypothetical protein
MPDELPPCGVFRTLKPIAGIEAGRLVYFHNHGDPGPGLYFPERWNHNRAQWSPNGTTLPQPIDLKALMPLPAEGFYRVARTFVCCAKKCVEFRPEQFVQLGYNGAGKPLVFIPEFSGGAITVPQRGTAIDDDVLTNLVALQINERREPDNSISFPRGIVVH